MSNDKHTFEDIIAGLDPFGFEIRTKPDPKRPRRRDFDVPLPPDCRRWLARITRKHREHEADA